MTSVIFIFNLRGEQVPIWSEKMVHTFPPRVWLFKQRGVFY